MKTKDLIKELQEIDPSGECHIRINSKPVWFLEGKPGYWDGTYNYLEKGEDGKYNWIQTIENDKIDIKTMDMFTFCEFHNGDWDEIEKHIRIEYDDYDDERKRTFLDNFKKECDEFNKIEREIEEEYKNK